MHPRIFFAPNVKNPGYAPTYNVYERRTPPSLVQYWQHLNYLWSNVAYTVYAKYFSWRY